MNHNKIIPYLVCDSSEILSIQYVDWSKFSFVSKENNSDNIFDYCMNGITFTDLENDRKEEIARQNFLKEEILKVIPNGEIVSAPRLGGNFYYDEWDAFNLIKFEIHSDCSDNLTYLRLVWFLRPGAINTLEALNQAFSTKIAIQELYSNEQEFEVSMEGWLECYKRAISIQNNLVDNLNKEVDNTPYYNIKNQWER